MILLSREAWRKLLQREGGNHTSNTSSPTDMGRGGCYEGAKEKNDIWRRRRRRRKLTFGAEGVEETKLTFGAEGAEEKKMTFGAEGAEEKNWHLAPKAPKKHFDIWRRRKKNDIWRRRRRRNKLTFGAEGAEEKN